MKSVGSITITIRMDGQIVLSASSYDSEKILLSPADAAKLAGLLVTSAGAALSDYSKPFIQALEVLRVGFDEFLGGLALQAADEAARAVSTSVAVDTVVSMVHCPHCESIAGDRCVKPDGRHTATHLARRQLFSQVYGSTQREED